MVGKLRAWFLSLTLRSKLTLAFVALGVLPLAALSVVFYFLSCNIILVNTMQSLHAIAQKNNEIVNLQFERCEEAALLLPVNEVLVELMNAPAPTARSTVMRGNLRIKKVLDQYFLGISDIFAYHLYTDDYQMVGNIPDPTIPNSKPAMYVPYESFPDTELCRAAAAANGQLVWTPTYGYEAMYDLNYDSVTYDYPYLFSAVKQINCIAAPAAGRRQPILIVSYKPEALGRMMGAGLEDRAGQMMYMMDGEGRIVYSSDAEQPTEQLGPELASLVQGDSGYARASVGGVDSIVAYDLQPNTGWKQVLVSPVSAYTARMSGVPLTTLLASLALAALLLVVVGAMLRRMTRSISQVVDGMNRLGEGEFMINLPVPQDAEMGFLARKFNEMDSHIHALIYENYEIRLREKEAQIDALNLQMNPHFLYNTLNTINWMAIDAHQAEISHALIRLSQMLQRGLRRKGDLCSLNDELSWLRDYLYIMRLRYENRFEVRQRIEARLMDTQVPCNLLQPLVENAVVHGFEDIDGGGLIVIEGNLLPDGRRAFTVVDNGAGFSQADAERALSEEPDGVGLGNLNRRLRILYGGHAAISIETRPGEGTRVTVTLPADAGT